MNGDGNQNVKPAALSLLVDAAAQEGRPPLMLDAGGNANSSVNSSLSDCPDSGGDQIHGDEDEDLMGDAGGAGSNEGANDDGDGDHKTQDDSDLGSENAQVWKTQQASKVKKQSGDERVTRSSSSSSSKKQQQPSKTNTKAKATAHTGQSSGGGPGSNTAHQKQQQLNQKNSQYHQHHQQQQQPPPFLNMANLQLHQQLNPQQQFGVFQGWMATAPQNSQHQTNNNCNNTPQQNMPPPPPVVTHTFPQFGYPGMFPNTTPQNNGGGPAKTTNMTTNDVVSMLVQSAMNQQQQQQQQQQKSIATSAATSQAPKNQQLDDFITQLIKAQFANSGNSGASPSLTSPKNPPVASFPNQQLNANDIVSLLLQASMTQAQTPTQNATPRNSGDNDINRPTATSTPPVPVATATTAASNIMPPPPPMDSAGAGAAGNRSSFSQKIQDYQRMMDDEDKGITTPVHGADSNLRQLQNQQRELDQEGVVTIPCRARGLPPEHRVKMAHFRISKSTKHGDGLICSYPPCRDAGIKFRYCAYCKTPVARRNFRSRHNHCEFMPVAKEDEIDEDVKMAPPLAEEPAAGAEDMGNEVINVDENVAAAAPEAAVNNRPSPPPAHLIPESSGSCTTSSGCRKQNRSSSPSVAAAAAVAATVTDGVTIISRQAIEKKRKSFPSAAHNKSSSSKKKRIRTMPAILSEIVTPRANISPERMNQWAELLHQRPSSKDELNMSKWLMTVLAVSDLKESGKADSSKSTSSTTSDSNNFDDGNDGTTDEDETAKSDLAGKKKTATIKTTSPPAT